MGTLLWISVIVLVLTPLASGLICGFGLDNILSSTCQKTTVNPGDCSSINGAYIPSICVCEPGFYGTTCEATVITIPDILCGNGGTNNEVSCICYDILRNRCKMIVVEPGTTIGPLSTTGKSTTTPASTFTDVSSSDITTHITGPTTDSTSELSSESSPEPPTVTINPESLEPPTVTDTTESLEPPTVTDTTESLEPPTVTDTTESPEPSTLEFTGSSTPDSSELSSMITDRTSTEGTTLSSSSSIISDEPPTTTDPCDGGTCVCPKHFYGKDCKFIYSEIRLDLVITKLQISIHVQDGVFNASLNDPSSSEYQRFKGKFLGEMMNVYKESLPRFKEIRNVSFRKGSIIVDHEVLLRVDYRKWREETQRAEDQLLSTLNNRTCRFDGSDRLCSWVNKRTIGIKTINKLDLCSEEESIPQVMKPFFSGVNMSTYLLCVTKCSVRHPSPINCNWGQCSVSDEGPLCYCDTSDQYWYTGDRCGTPVSKAGVIGGVVVGLIVLVAVILLLVVCLSCRRRSASKDLPADIYPPWHHHGFERDVREQGRLRNPETDHIMIGPHGAFQTTLETVNPEARISVPRPQMTS